VALGVSRPEEKRNGPHALRPLPTPPGRNAALWINLLMNRVAREYALTWSRASAWAAFQEHHFSAYGSLT